MLPSVLNNLGFAATASDAPVSTVATDRGGKFLLIGTGCWAVIPLVAVLLGAMR